MRVELLAAQSRKFSRRFATVLYAVRQCIDIYGQWISEGKTGKCGPQRSDGVVSYPL